MKLKHMLIYALSAAAVFGADIKSNNLEARVNAPAVSDENEFNDIVAKIKEITYDGYERIKKGESLNSLYFRKRISGVFNSYGYPYGFGYKDIGAINEEFFKPRDYYFTVSDFKSENKETPDIILAKLSKEESIDFNEPPINGKLNRYYLKDYVVVGYKQYRNGTKYHIKTITQTKEVMVDEDAYYGMVVHNWNVLLNASEIKPKTKDYAKALEIEANMIKENLTQTLNDSNNDFNRFYELLLPKMVDDALGHEVFHIYSKAKNESVLEETIAEIFRLKACKLGSFCLAGNITHLSDEGGYSNVTEKLFREILGVIKKEKPKFSNISVEGNNLIGQSSELWKLTTEQINYIGGVLFNKYVKP